MLSSTLYAFAFVLLEPLDQVRLQGRFQGRDACFAQRQGAAATIALTTAVRSQLCRVESPSCAGVADHQQLMRVHTFILKNYTGVDPKHPFGNFKCGINVEIAFFSQLPMLLASDPVEVSVAGSL